jgi:hypothetical protein
MKQYFELPNVDLAYSNFHLATLGQMEVEDLIQACSYRLNELIAERLNVLGFSARTEFHGVKPNLVLVQLPNAPDDMPGEWATLAECKRLIDTARNLSPAEAFARWREKIEPIKQEEYTRADAINDMRRERAEAKADFESGKIGAEDLRLRNQYARDYMSFIGSKTSDRKAESSRRNGRLGGRPKKSE